MILTMISLVYLFLILLDRDKIDNQSLNNYLKLFIIYLCFIFTIKPFFIINFIFFMILFFHKRLRIKTFDLFFSKTFYISLFLVLFTIFYTFINSGCLIFPLSITCFENLSWSIDKEHINEVSRWFELWSKNGASPNFEIEDKKTYLENFNWLSTWLNGQFNYISEKIILNISILAIFLILLILTKKIVKENKSFQPRISISWNIFYEPKIN